MKLFFSFLILVITFSAQAKTEYCWKHYGMKFPKNVKEETRAKKIVAAFNRGQEIRGLEFYGPGLCWLSYTLNSHSIERKIDDIVSYSKAQQSFLAKKGALVKLTREHFPHADEYCQQTMPVKMEHAKQRVRDASKNGYKYGYVSGSTKYNWIKHPHGRAVGFVTYPDLKTPTKYVVRRDPVTQMILVLQPLEDRTALCIYPKGKYSFEKLQSAAN